LGQAPDRTPAVRNTFQESHIQLEMVFDHELVTVALGSQSPRFAEASPQGNIADQCEYPRDQPLYVAGTDQPPGRTVFDHFGDPTYPRGHDRESVEHGLHKHPAHPFVARGQEEEVQESEHLRGIGPVGPQVDPFLKTVLGEKGVDLGLEGTVADHHQVNRRLRLGNPSKGQERGERIFDRFQSSNPPEDHGLVIETRGSSGLATFVLLPPAVLLEDDSGMDGRILLSSANTTLEVFLDPLPGQGHYPVGEGSEYALAYDEDRDQRSAEIARENMAMGSMHDHRTAGEQGCEAAEHPGFGGVRVDQGHLLAPEQTHEFQQRSQILSRGEVADQGGEEDDVPPLLAQAPQITGWYHGRSMD